MMELRNIKKEIQELPNLTETVKNFQDNWIKPLRSNNAHLPFLKTLSPAVKRELDTKVTNLQASIAHLQNSQHIHDRLKHHSHNLIELKLTTFNGDKNKQKMLTNRLLNDDFQGIKSTVTHVKNFNDHANFLFKQYDEINRLLDKQLSLEETVYFMNLPHRKYLSTLIKTGEQQQKIVRDLGRHFIKLTDELEMRKAMHR